MRHEHEEPEASNSKRRPPRRPASTERDPADGPDRRIDPLGAFQRAAGNASMARLVQAKLTVGDVDDPTEHEAERIAGQIGTGVQADPVRAAGSRSGIPVSGDIEARIDAARGGGRPLADDVRESMEAGLGSDLGGVRVHTDSNAAQLSRALNAEAFTTGSDVFMASGRYAPGTSQGRDLLAHELVHVVQQTGAVQRVPSLIQRHIGDPNSVAWASAGGIVPSGGGALGGVVFMTVGSDQVAIKPGTGSAASAVFAEDVLGAVGGAQTTESVIVKRTDAAFQKILARIISAHSEALDPANAGTPAARHANRWGDTAFMRFYTGADFFMIQKSMKSQDLGTAQRPAAQNEDFSDVYKNDPMRILQDVTFLENVGRALVADLLIGNADRLESINGGNFFVLGNSRFGAIDNESFFPGQKLVTDFLNKDLGKDQVSKEPLHKQWADYLIGGGPGITSSAATSNIRWLYDRLDTWIQSSFMGQFSKLSDPKIDAAQRARDQQRVATLNASGFPIGEGQAPTEQQVSGSQQWILVRDAIRRGYADGIQRLHQNLTGSRGVQLRQRFLALQQEYGETESMDFGAFEIRAAYLEARHQGKTHAAAFDIAAKKAEVKVDKKVQRVVDSAVSYSLLTKQGAARLAAALSELSKDEQESLIHIRPGFRKQAAKIPLLGSGDRFDKSFERLRAKLLVQFLHDLDGEDLSGKSVASSAAFLKASKEAQRILGVFRSHSADSGHAQAVAIWTGYNIA